MYIEHFTGVISFCNIRRQQCITVNGHDGLFYGRCKASIDSFASGMEQVLGNVVQREAEAYLPLFVHVPNPLTRLSLKQLCVYERSEPGSNKAAAEEDTLYAWETLLLNIEGTASAVQGVVIICIPWMVFLFFLFPVV